MKNKKSIKTGSQVNNDITIDFGNRLKKTRGQLHLSQKDFAARLDIAGSYLSEIEAGKTRPGFEFFYKTSKIFKINPVYLLHGDGSVFLETENRWDHDIDFGSLNCEVQKLILHMEQAPTVGHAMLDFFARYLYDNQGLITEEIKTTREKKKPMSSFPRHGKPEA